MTTAVLAGSKPARSPLWWIIAAGSLFGLVVLGYYFHAAVRVYPAPALITTLLLFVTGLFGWFVFRRARPLLPPNRPPLLACMLWGGLAASGCAVLANDGLTSIWAKTVGIGFASNWSAALAAPLNEELLKLAGVILLSLAVPGLIRTPMDGFITGAFVGLGFQLVEDLIYALQSITLAGAITPIGSALQSFLARVLFTGWGSHWTYTAITGAGYGYYHTRRHSARRIPIFIGLVLTAMALHWFFDSPLLANAIGTAVKVLLDLATALSVYIVLRRDIHRQALRIAATVFSDTAPEAVTNLLTRRRRRRARKPLPRGPQRTQAEAAQQAELATLDRNLDTETA